MPPRVLVVDRASAMRDVVAELLGGHASEVAWASRDAAVAELRAAHAGGQPFDVVLLEGDPAPSAAHVRELSTAGGARVVLIASGADGIAAAERCGAADVIARPLSAAELAFRVGRASPADARGEKRRPRKSDVLIGSGAWIKELYDR